MEKEQAELKLIYLKGFLDSLSYINTFTNDGKSYNIKLIEKEGVDYQSIFRKYFNKKSWEIKTEILNGNWRKILQNEIIPFFDQIIFEAIRNIDKNLSEDSLGIIINDIRKNIDFHIYHLLLDKFCDCVEEFLPLNPIFMRVEINWTPENADYEGFYECYSRDFLFDLGDQILFLHFGISD